MSLGYKAFEECVHDILLINLHLSKSQQYAHDELYSHQKLLAPPPVFQHVVCNCSWKNVLYPSLRLLSVLINTEKLIIQFISRSSNEKEGIPRTLSRSMQCVLIYDTEGVETIFLGSKFPEELAGVSMHFPLALQKRKVGVQSLSFCGERSEVLSLEIQFP